MAFDYTTAMTMTRSLSVLIKSRPDSEILEALQNHAVPRIEGYLMTATNSAGQYVFYNAISDMADSSKASQVESLVRMVMDEPLVAASVRRIAAAFACSWVLMSNLGIIESQQEMAQILEKQGMADLKNLVKSEVISKSIDSVLPKFNAANSKFFYFAQDCDPSTADIINKTATAYNGAQQSGKITAIINGYAVEAPILIGDTPIQIVNKLAIAINAAQSTGSVNVSAAANQGPETTGMKNHADSDPISGNPRNTQLVYSTNLTSLMIVPFKYDNVVDFVTVTVYITHDNGTDQDPGNTGIIYGITDNAYSLTKEGPYAVAIDLNTGKSTSLSDSKGLVSDSLFFQGVTTIDGTITYSINDSGIQTVDVPANSTAQQICELLSRDLASKAVDQRLLGAVRPSTLLTVNGSSETAPGLTFVAFTIDRVLAKLVFNLHTVPDGIIFGVVPPTLITLANFDSSAKSVIVDTVVSIGGNGSSQGEPLTPATPIANSYLAVHRNSARLDAILDKDNWRMP